ncbi:NmrA family NAD(P)-binding protein [Nocardia macrotermitis]|nr:NmrA family NAD(P)-binding protein [Nocardia macrotermitis]
MPQAPAARELAAAGAEVVRGDFADPDSLMRAVDGVYGVFSVQSFHEEGTEVERRNGRAMAAAAARAGVEHFVYSSVGGADCGVGIGFHDSKFDIERHIVDLGLRYTIFRPVFSMRNWGQVRADVRAGVLPWPLAPDTVLQQLAFEDLAVFVGKAFREPRHWIGRITELAGDESTMAEVADVFGKVLGRPVRYQRIPLDRFSENVRAATGSPLDADHLRMLRWFDEDGFHADLPALRAEYPGLTSFEQFLRRSGWF